MLVLTSSSYGLLLATDSAEFVEFADSRSLSPRKAINEKSCILSSPAGNEAAFEEDKLLKINFPINWSKRRSFCH